MLLLELVLMLLLCAVALGWVARHFHFPYPIALVLGGAALGFVPRLPQFPFDPQLILVLVLPPILYQAALLTSWYDFKANLRSIGFLAIGMVVVTTLAVGAALKLMLPGIPWAAAFVLGAIVSPPDAVAATAILSRLNIPRRIVTILEGESLVNDASGLVLYKFAVAAVLTGGFSLMDASVQFTGLALGGLGLGVGLAYVFIALHKRLGDPFIELLTTLLIPYTAYIVAETLHVSGVLAVVAAGLVRGRYAPEIVSAEMRIMARPVWNTLVFVLNSLVFMLIGIQLSDGLESLARFDAAELLRLGVVVSLVTVAIRFVWVFPAAFLARLAPCLQDQGPPLKKRELTVISWCGMRGIVSLAAALALPHTLPDGTPFPERDLIIFLTFVVILVTLVGQGLTLSAVIVRFKVGTDWQLATEQARIRVAMSTAALGALERIVAEEKVPEGWAAPLRREISERIALMAPAAGGDTPRTELANRLRQAAIRAERQELIRLWRNNEIGDELLHHLEKVLDYQEADLRSAEGH